MKPRVNNNDFDVNHPDFQRVFLRRTNSRVVNTRPDFGELVAWFATKENMAFGYSVYKLSDSNMRQLRAYNIETVNVFKYATESYDDKPAESGFVMIDLGKGYVRFLDYSKIGNDVKNKWYKEKVRFDRLFIEQNTGDTFSTMELP